MVSVPEDTEGLSADSGGWGKVEATENQAKLSADVVAGPTDAGCGCHLHRRRFPGHGRFGCCHQQRWNHLVSLPADPIP